MKSIDVLIIGIRWYRKLHRFIRGSLGIINLVLQPFGQLRMIIHAVALILIMIFRPGGLLWDLGIQTRDFAF